MNLEDYMNIGKFLGMCKIWSANALQSEFFVAMPRPLIQLSDTLKRCSIQNETISEIDQFIKKTKEIIVIENKNKKNREVIKLQKVLVPVIGIWQDRIVNEIRKIKVVKLTTDTVLNPDKLAEGAKSFFKDEIWNTMTDLEKLDLEDGCRCISLQSWTPASMITMRVIESSFRNYYKQITNKDTNDQFWGNMIAELKNDQSADQKLLGYYDYLKDIRNKLQHPDARLSQFEAEDVFHHAIHILNTIYS